MIRTGADIKNTIIMKEIELEAGKDVKKGLIAAIIKVQSHGRTDAIKNYETR